jgi:hypothetical protein
MAIVGYDSASNSIITSFRGSDNIKNWLEDANFIKSDYGHSGCSNCKVHSGFINCYNSLKDSLNSYLKNTMYPTYSGAKVVVTGHSLGAAESMFAAID